MLLSFEDYNYPNLIKYNNDPKLIELILNDSKNLNLNLKSNYDETALTLLFKNNDNEINKNDKLKLFNLLLSYKYSKLNIIV